MTIPPRAAPPDALDEDTPFTDDELTRLALAADPDAEIPADAVPLWDVLAPATEWRTLPAWYMPTPDPRGPDQLLRGWRRAAVSALIVTFVGINAYGLCNTYGDLRIR